MITPKKPALSARGHDASLATVAQHSAVVGKMERIGSPIHEGRHMSYFIFETRVLLRETLARDRNSIRHFWERLNRSSCWRFRALRYMYPVSSQESISLRKET